VFSNIQKIRLNYSSNDVKNEKAQVLLNLCTIKIFLTRGTDEDLLNQPTNQPTNQWCYLYDPDFNSRFNHKLLATCRQQLCFISLQTKFSLDLQ